MRLETTSASADPLFFTIVDKAVVGRKALMRVETNDGVFEIGHIMWSAAPQRTRMATEALFQFADHIFGRKSPVRAA